MESGIVNNTTISRM